MKSIVSKYKYLIIGGVAAFMVAGGAGWAYLDSKREVDITSPSSQEQQEGNVATDTVENGSETTEDDTAAKDTGAESYEIIGLNKVDGDVFSIPDNLKFSVQPGVDKVEVEVILAGGTVVFSKTYEQSNVDVTIYPERKISTGTTGGISIKAYKNSELVVQKTIGVVF